MSEELVVEGGTTQSGRTVRTNLHSERTNGIRRAIPPPPQFVTEELGHNAHPEGETWTAVMEVLLPAQHLVSSRNVSFLV